MKKNSLYIIVAILILFCQRHNSPITETRTEPQHHPEILSPESIDENIVLIDENIDDTIDSNIDIIYNDLDYSKKLAYKQNKSIIVIFAADWCRFCQYLKHDQIKILEQYPNCIMCIIDIQIEPILAKQWSIKTLPTSIILSHKNNMNEIARKAGYKYEDYILWLDKYTN